MIRETARCQQALMQVTDRLFLDSAAIAPSDLEGSGSNPSSVATRAHSMPCHDYLCLLDSAGAV